MNPENIQAVSSWPIPKNKKEVESFIGFANYHRDHIKQFAEMAVPLHTLTGSKAEFHWNSEQQTAFEDLKLALIQAATLSYPNPDDLFMLDTDASNVCIGA